MYSTSIFDFLDIKLRFSGYKILYGLLRKYIKLFALNNRKDTKHIQNDRIKITHGLNIVLSNPQLQNCSMQNG